MMLYYNYNELKCFFEAIDLVQNANLNEKSRKT